MVISFTFRQLGQSAISGSRVWHTPAVIRSSIMNNVNGGWSKCLTCCLRRILFGPSGLATARVVLDLPSGPVPFFGRLGNLLTDGDGWRITWDWKGASSHRPCFRHWNVLRKGGDLAWRRPGYCELTCSDPFAFKPWPVDDIYFAVDLLMAADDRVEAGTLPRVRLSELEVACGLNLNRDGILAATDLRHTQSQLDVQSFVAGRTPLCFVA